MNSQFFFLQHCSAIQDINNSMKKNTHTVRKGEYKAKQTDNPEI